MGFGGGSLGGMNIGSKVWERVERRKRERMKVAKVFPGVTVNVTSVQRQLQVRIEAQGKYLKEIIEEQQRLTGMLAKTPSLTEVSRPESDEKIDPSTPVPTSESPLQGKSASTTGLFKNLLHDESFTSRHGPLTPDSSAFNFSSLSESPRVIKRQCISSNEKTELVPAHHIVESSSCSEFQNFDSSGTSVGDDD